MNGVRRALLLSTGDRYYSLVINFLTVAIISRILTPAEIGLSVVGVAIVGMTMSLREFASSNFLIQQRDLTPADIRCAFTVMLALTTVISTGLFVFAPLVAGIYDEPPLAGYLRIIAVATFVELVAAPIVTLLRRDMAFGRVALINMAGATTGTVVTIMLALHGFSAMSFAWAWLATAVVTGLLAILIKPEFWIFKPSLAQSRRMLAFGGYNGATVLLYKMHESLPYLLLGRMLSLDAAALYSRSLMICQLPDKVFLAGAVSVVLPAFSAEVRQGRSLKQPYLNALGLITAFQWPALATLALLAYPMVDVVLGHQWGAAVPLVQIISLSLFFSFSFELNYPVLVSMGAIRDIFLRALIVCPVSAGLIAGASFISLEAVAWSLMFIMPFQAFVGLHFIRRHMAVAWGEIAGSLWRSAIVALITAAGPALVIMLSGSGFQLPIRMAIVAIVLAGIFWLVALWLTRHPLREEITGIIGKLGGRLSSLKASNRTSTASS